MIEKTILINNTIPGTLSLPGKNVNTASKAVVLLHGFASDKNETGCKEAYIDLASRLSQNMIISLRIDFSGWGDNTSLSQEKSTVNTMLQDAIDAFKYLKNLASNQKIKIGYIGFSLGAAVSILAANRLDGDCDFLGLLSPVGDLPGDFEEFLGEKNYNEWARCECSTQIKLPWKTIRLGRGFAESLYAYKIKNEASKLSIPFICIAGSNDFSAKHSKFFIENSSSKKSKLIIYDKTDHCLNAFSKDIKLYDALDNISKWVKEST